MSQQVKSLNFPVEENYTIRLMKEVIAFHYPDEVRSIAAATRVKPTKYKQLSLNCFSKTAY